MFSIAFKNFFQKLFIIFGYKIQKINTSDKKFTLFKYKNYKEYRDTQIFFNKKKLITPGQIKGLLI